MGKHRITYIGELPPPYGGVSVKNKLILEKIFCNEDVKMIDLVKCKRNRFSIPKIFIEIIYAMMTSNTIIIGVGTTTRRKILLTMQEILGGRRRLKKIVMIVMGGMIQEQTKTDLYLRKILCGCRSVWVQAYGMKKALEDQGLNNVKYFPTCKDIRNSIPPLETINKIRIVFFSRICKKKGILEVIKALQLLETKKCEYSIDFYGELDEEIKDPFFEFINNNNNANYFGVFDGTSDNVYELLNKYDVMVLPTKWEGEGIPNALVEAKISGITAIVSDWKYNSEVVIDGVEGIVISDPLDVNLSESIIKLYNDKKLLEKLKLGSYESRERYSLDKYKNDLLHDVTIGE